MQQYAFIRKSTSFFVDETLENLKMTSTLQDFTWNNTCKKLGTLNQFGTPYLEIFCTEGKFFGFLHIETTQFLHVQPVWMQFCKISSRNIPGF